MAYASWSVVFGEQPSAAKWNILGTNDASFNDGTGIANGTITSEHLNATIACRAYRNAAMNITGGGAAEKVILDAKNYDLGSDWDTTNGRFTAPLTGYYQVNSSIRLSSVNDAGIVFNSIYVNGSSYSLVAQNSSTSSASGLSAWISDIVPVTAGQYIEMYADCSTTEAIITGTESTFMSISFLGA